MLVSQTASSRMTVVEVNERDQAALLAGVRTANLYLTLNRPDYEPVPVPFEPIVPNLPGEQGISPYPESSDEGGQ